MLFSRLADLDSKLNGILAKLSAQAEAPTAPGIPPTKESSAIPDHIDTTEHDIQASSDAYSLSTPNRSVSDRGHVRTAHNNWADKLNLVPSELDQLLLRFRVIQHFFPFVIIPETWTASWMLAERPFLLLTVITAVSKSKPSLHAALGEEIKMTLARRIMIADENNLDLLQGLLVHLAW